MSSSPAVVDPALGEALTPPVRVAPRSQLTWVDGLLVIAGIIMAIVAIVVATDGANANRWRDVALWGGGAVLLFVTCWVHGRMRSASNFHTVTAYAEGLQVARGNRRLVVFYRDLRGVALRRQDDFAQGVMAGVTLGFRLWKTENFKARPLCEVAGYFKADNDAANLMLQVMNRLVETGAAAMREARTRGARFPGGDFLVEPTGLRVGALHLPWENIASCGLFDKQVCIWKKGEAMPVVRLSPDGVNAQALFSFLAKELEGRPEEPAADKALGPLGRVLFERKYSKAAAWACWVIGALFLLGLIPLVIAAAAPRPPESIAVLIIGALLGALAFAVAGWHLARFCFRCHEIGVFRQGLVGTRQLNYGDVTSFGYTATRVYVNGAYTGTTIAMRFAAPQLRQKPISYQTTVQGEDADLEVLRDHIAKVVAGKMLTTMDADGEVQWTPDLFLARDQVRYRPKKLFGKGDFVTLPLAEVADAVLHEGSLLLYQKSEEKPVFTMPSSTPNFFPGLLLLGMLLSPPAPAAPKEEPLPELPLPGEGDGPSRN